MIKACVLLFCIALSLWPLIAWCTTLDAHSYRKWRPGMEPFFNELEKEATKQFKKHPRAFSYEVATPATSTATNTQTEYSIALQADINKIFDDVRKDFDPQVEKNLVYTSTASSQTVDHAKRKPSTDSLSTPGYAKYVPSAMDYTEASVSTESRENTKSTSTVSDLESEYLKELKPMMDTFFDVFFRVAGRESKKETTIKGHASSESQAAKKYVKDAHSTASYTKNGAGGQTTQSYQDGYSATVHPVSLDYPVRIGSVKGVPGIDFPYYTDIPLTSFTCSDMDYFPGFYADLETRCQVFHACWPNRRESFLCPLGTTFNQALMACDYWYSTNCSLAPHYYNVNAETSQLNKAEGKTLSSMISALLQKGDDSLSTIEDSSKAVPVTPETVVSFISRFLPVKAKVVIYPDTAGKRAKIVASASVGDDTVKKVRVEKPHRQFGVVKEQRPDTTESSNVPYSTEQSHSTKVPKYASKEAVDLILGRLAVAVKNFVEDYDDVMDRNYTIKPRRWPVLDESKYKAHPHMRVLDEAAQKLLDKLSDGIIGFFYEGAKRLDMKKAESKKTAAVKTYTLTRLNPRFIIKPVDVPKEVKHTKSAPQPTQSSIKTSTTKRATILKPETSGQYRGPGISPLTKKALAKNYVRFLRAKSG